MTTSRWIGTNWFKALMGRFSNLIPPMGMDKCIEVHKHMHSNMLDMREFRHISFSCSALLACLIIWHIAKGGLLYCCSHLNMNGVYFSGWQATNNWYRWIWGCMGDGTLGQQGDLFTQKGCQGKWWRDVTQDQIDPNESERTASKDKANINKIDLSRIQRL